MEKVAVVGLGYVGLPVALAFARHFPGTIGFDIDHEKVEELHRGHDRTGEHDVGTLRRTSLQMTADPADLRGCTFFVVAVPTPVDQDNRPDLSATVRASETVGRVLSGGAVVVYESTVYPGVTEEICGPILERESGLRAGKDFKLGYSPERINPGDKEHTLERITKVVSGQDAADARARRRRLRPDRRPAGVHRAPSIKVAEAAKVIENTQRDLNIALMNELALIFDRLGIRTADVLAAARTKWNFLPFTPGLVGRPLHRRRPVLPDHRRRSSSATSPRSSSRAGASTTAWASSSRGKLVKLLINADLPVKGARVGVLGLTFKEDVLRPAQQQGAGHRARTGPVRDRAARPRPLVRARRCPARVRDHAVRSRGADGPRRPCPRRAPYEVPRRWTGEHRRDAETRRRTGRREVGHAVGLGSAERPPLEPLIKRSP